MILLRPDQPEAVELSEEQKIENSIRSAQEVERESAQEGIYYVSRQVAEGLGKPMYAKEELGLTEETSRRFDRVDTYQQGDNVLTLISSTKTEGSFESFLSLVNEGGEVELWYHGSTTDVWSKERLAYDDIHNLSSLYGEFVAAGRPGLPLLDSDDEFLDINYETNRARFKHHQNESVWIDVYVNLDTEQVVEELLYVEGESGAVYEIAKVIYHEREVLEMERFREVFNMEEFPYEAI